MAHARLPRLHSGVFTRSQYQARYGVSAQTAGRFVRALVDARWAHEGEGLGRSAARPISVCHVNARTLYRALGIENHCHRRRASPEITIRRLLCLDYILEHPEQSWLPPEADKVAYFERLGMAPETLPQRPYAGPFTVRPTRRYVALKVPVASYGPTTTFVYADAGARHRTHHEWIRGWASGPSLRHGKSLMPRLCMRRRRAGIPPCVSLVRFSVRSQSIAWRGHSEQH